MLPEPPVDDLQDNAGDQDEGGEAAEPDAFGPVVGVRGRGDERVVGEVVAAVGALVPDERDPLADLPDAGRQRQGDLLARGGRDGGVLGGRDTVDRAGALDLCDRARGGDVAGLLEAPDGDQVATPANGCQGAGDDHDEGDRAEDP